MLPGLRFNVNSTGIIQLLAGYDYNGVDPVAPLLQVLGTMRLALDDFSETKQAVSSRASAAALEELAAIEALMAAAVEAEPAAGGPDDGAASPVSGGPSGGGGGGGGNTTDVVSLAVRRV